MMTAEELVKSTESVKEQELYKLGTVTDLFPIGTAQIKFDGEDAPSEKEYSYLESFRPVIGDRVLITQASGTYIILGKINYNEKPSSGQISQIDNNLYVNAQLSCNSFHHRGNYLSFFNKWQNVQKQNVGPLTGGANNFTTEGAYNAINVIVNALRAYGLF